MSTSKITVCALGGTCLLAGAMLAQDLGASLYALPREMASSASEFGSSVASTVDFDRLPDGAAVTAGLRKSAAYEPARLEENMIVYSAVVALREKSDAPAAGGPHRTVGRRAPRQSPDE